MASENKLKQPKIFYLASMTAAFERFGFYVLSFLLVLYVKNVYNFSDKEAFGLFAIFNALVYLTPAIGGYLGDNVFGIRRMVILGLLFEGIGFNLLAFQGLMAFYFGLSLVILGVGFFKTGPTNLMARKYKDNDPRIDSGFTLYYMWINVGSFSSSFAAGIIQRYYGWHAAFLFAAIMLYLSLGVYFLLRGSAKEVDSVFGKARLSLAKYGSIFVIFLLGLLIGAFLVSHSGIGSFILYASIIGLLVFFMFEMIKSPKDEKMSILACLILILMGTAFFILYFQLYESVPLFIERCVVTNYFNFNLPVTFYFGLNPISIFILSPLLALLYNRWAKKGKDLAVTTKFPMGIAFIGLCYITLYIGTFFYNADVRISSWWMVFAIFLYSLGELLISALGVAMVTRIVPKRLYGVMMGAWFLMGAALGSTFSGLFASLSDVPQNMVDPLSILHIYGKGFLIVGVFGLVIAALAFAISPYVKRMARLN